MDSWWHRQHARPSQSSADANPSDNRFTPTPSTTMSNADYMAGMGSGVDPESTISVASRDDFFASLDSMRGTMPTTPHQPDDPPLDSSPLDSQNHGYPGCASNNFPNLEVPPIRGPYEVQQYTRLFESSFLERVLRDGAPSSRADTTVSDLDVPSGRRYTQSMPSPLNTSISSIEVPSYSPNTEQSRYAHSSRNPGPQGSYLRPPASAGTYSYATSELSSEQDDDRVFGSCFSPRCGEHFGTQSSFGMENVQRPSPSDPGQWLDLEYGLGSARSAWNDPCALGRSLNQNSLAGDLVNPSTQSSGGFSPNINSHELGGDLLSNSMGLPPPPNVHPSTVGNERIEQSSMLAPCAPSAGVQNRPRRHSQHSAFPSTDHYLSGPSPTGMQVRGERNPLHRSTSQNPQLPPNQGSYSAVSTTAKKDWAPTGGGASPLQQTQLLQKPRRGRRARRMTEQEKKQTRQKRKDRSTCINCKTSRVACNISSNSSSCSKCEKPNRLSKAPCVCVRADFFGFVEQGPLDYIAQYSVNHQKMDGAGRLRLEIPSTIDYGNILQQIDHLIARSCDSIRVSLGGDTLYYMDLNECHAYLMSIRRGTEPLNFRKFVNEQLRKDGDDWLKCVRFPDPMMDDLEKLIRCSEMLSRHTFTLTSQSIPAEQYLDPGNQFHKGTFDVAALFSRVVVRGLELRGLKWLQRVLTETNSGRITPELSVRLGRILLSLRWRLAWWKTFGSGLPEHHSGIEEGSDFIERVTEVSKILYFYFLHVRNRRLSGSAEFTLPKGWETWHTDMPPGTKIFEAFPEDESMEGFRSWMQEGISKICEAVFWRRQECMGWVQ